MTNSPLTNAKGRWAVYFTIHRSDTHLAVECNFCHLIITNSETAVVDIDLATIISHALKTHMHPQG